MIATSTSSKIDYYATNSTASNSTLHRADCEILSEVIEIVWIATREETEPERKQRVERTAQRYIDHLWPVVYRKTASEHPSAAVGRPRPRQMASEYG